MIEFVIQSGKHRGKRLSFPMGKVIVGRETGCQIRLTSDDVSRNHCEMESTDEGVTVRDLSSRNGTFINDVRVEGDSLLKPGDLLRIGPMVLMLPLPATGGQQSGVIADDESTSDDDIASWLSDSEKSSGGSGDTTIIRNVAAPPPKEPVAPPPPLKKVYKSIAEEAADIIRRHREGLQDDA